MNFELPYDAFLRVIKENADVNHAFLLGAGASITSGIQPARDCIWEWKRNIFITKNPALAKQYALYKSETVQRALQKWIDTEGIYPAENSVEEYSFFASTAYPIEETRAKYFENVCKGKEPYVGYKILCELSKKGMVKSVFTTNFDGMVEKAAHQTGINPIAISLANANYIHRASSNTEILCVALHGDFKYGPLKNTSTELDSQHDAFVAALKQHLYDKHLIIVGYSGRDISLMRALKEAYSQAGGGMLFWCGYGNEINIEIQELLTHLQNNGRKGFFVSTEGFDTIMIHIAKTCFDQDQDFHSEIDKQLRITEDDTVRKTPFSLDVTEKNVLLRSNLFPISLPRELFQVEVSFPENEKVWQTIKNHIGNKNISSVPIKGCLYSFGTQSDIRETFAELIKGEIKRTPVTYREIKEGSSFKSLYLSTITKSISKLFNLETNGKNRVWANESNSINKDSITYKVHDALEISLFFDDKIYAGIPFAYLSINPTFQIISENDIEVPKSLKFEFGKSYHEKLLSGQPNVKFNDQINR